MTNELPQGTAHRECIYCDANSVTRAVGLNWCDDCGRPFGGESAFMFVFGAVYASLMDAREWCVRTVARLVGRVETRDAECQMKGCARDSIALYPCKRREVLDDETIEVCRWHWTTNWTLRGLVFTVLTAALLSLPFAAIWMAAEVLGA